MVKPTGETSEECGEMVPKYGRSYVLSAEMQAAGLRAMDSAPRDGTVIFVLTRDRELTTCKFDATDVRKYWTLNVCGTYADDGEIEPIGWQPVSDDLLALQSK